MFSFRHSHIRQMFSFQVESHQSDVQFSGSVTVVRYTVLDSVTAVTCSVSGSVTSGKCSVFRLSHISHMASFRIRHGNRIFRFGVWSVMEVK